MGRKVRFEVVLNGTKENPWAKLGLTQNPFPQIAKAEYTPGLLKVQSLAGEPIKDCEDIRYRLEGFSREFIELCCSRFIPGETVKFTVSFDEA
jgi:hypothetical protein